MIPSRLKGIADISEEGLGFGVPIAQYWRDFVFPGTSEVSCEGLVPEGESWKTFDLNMIERHQGSVKNRVQMFSWVYQRAYNRYYKSYLGQKLARLTKPRNPKAAAGSRIKEPTFLRVASRGKVTTRYQISSCRIDLQTRVSGLSEEGLQHVYIANELGGTVFDHFYDDSGTRLHGETIGGWKHVHAERAAFVAPSLDLAFVVEIPDGVECYVGREIIAPDIHWSGVVLQLDDITEEVAYTVRMTTARGAKVVSL